MKFILNKGMVELMKQGAKTELTREKIMRATLQEFGINGYDAASVNAVCERHYISKGLIYYNLKVIPIN